MTVNFWPSSLHYIVSSLAEKKYKYSAGSRGLTAVVTQLPRGLFAVVTQCDEDLQIELVGHTTEKKSNKIFNEKIAHNQSLALSQLYRVARTESVTSSRSH